MLCDAAAAWFVNAAAPIVLRDVWVWFMHPYERQEVSYVSRYFEVILLLIIIIILLAATPGIMSYTMADTALVLPLLFLCRLELHIIVKVNLISNP